MRQTFIISVNLAVVVMLFIVPIAAFESGETLIVTSTANSGTGSFREALLNASPGDSITFDSSVFPPDNPHTIYLNSPLPSLSRGNLIIDASNAGVVIDGSGITLLTDGLSVFSNHNIIRGLHFMNFNDCGIALVMGAQNNIIGGDRNIGQGPSGQGNIITGECTNGIALLYGGTSFNTIQGNIIGTDSNGSSTLGNFNVGIILEDAINNLIMDNIIGGYKENGVHIGAGGGHNTIRNNSLGTNTSGTNNITASGQTNGIDIVNSSFNVIGPNNVIANNGEYGIHVFETKSVSNRITQNSIYNNGKLGIVLWEGANTQLSAPAIYEFNLQEGTLTGVTCPNCIVEIFSDKSDEGEIYEGQTLADNTGIFTFNKGAPFINTHLTATATDADSNTSRFSNYTPAATPALSNVIQEGNNSARTRLQAKRSEEIMDNRIMGGGGLSWICDLGVKWVNFSMNEIEWNVSSIRWLDSEFKVSPGLDNFVTVLHDRGIHMNNQMVFWDKANHPWGEGWPATEGWQPEGGFSRFQTDEEIERYIEFVRFNVRHFRHRVQYYEFWNEPDNGGLPVQHIRVPDYIRLIKRVVPAIREEYSVAKVLVGSVVLQHAQDYFFELIKSDEAMPLIDGLVWHPLFGSSPAYDSEWYYKYPSVVQAIKDTATAHGFKGEYFAEAGWDEVKTPGTDQPVYSAIQCAKYYARSIIMHRGMDIVNDAGGLWPERTLVCNTVQNLATLMAGVTIDTLDLQIQCNADNLRNFNFTSPDGNKMIALYTDGVAVDVDPGVSATLTVSGFADNKVFGIDVLTGFQQELITEEENGNLVIRDLLVKDYPIILLITSSESSVNETDKSPYMFALHQNYPNPFNPNTSIVFQVPVRSQVSIKIYNVRGQEIRTFVKKDVEPGIHTIEWNGQDKVGIPVATGIYLIKMKSGDYVKTRKCLLLK